MSRPEHPTTLRTYDKQQSQEVVNFMYVHTDLYPWKQQQLSQDSYMKSMQTVKSPKYPVEPMNIDSGAIVRGPGMISDLQRNYFSSGQDHTNLANKHPLRKGAKKQRTRKNIPNSMTTYRPPGGGPTGSTIYSAQTR